MTCHVRARMCQMRYNGAHLKQLSKRELKTVMSPPIIYIDVDDTFVRSIGTKRIPMPNVLRHIRELKEQVPFSTVGVRAAPTTPVKARENLASKTVSRRSYPSRTS